MTSQLISFGIPQSNDSVMLISKFATFSEILFGGAFAYIISSCQTPIDGFLFSSSFQQTRKDISTVEDPFDAPTYNIPEKPVTFTEGASCSLIILLPDLELRLLQRMGFSRNLYLNLRSTKYLGRLLKGFKMIAKARIGSPITGYGSESRNRAARQRIPHNTWTDEEGVEHVMVNFYIRGPHGAGKAYAEMFKDKVDKQWKFMYLIVEMTSPSPAQLMLESYVPA
ncbi:putative mitochondrial import inner membrane translocase subunit TIM21 [Abeliophyllum distichum]|uniref:Mitochondrial import inner membrane translocase subunit Tim21 n=1 Tax=Abeliophyllum distichum TaxID=126358 RepID=A0ABD1PAG2_9LAMI